MKIAVLSDIHSNHIALEAALTRIEKEQPDHLIFLGDYISDCPYPQKTTALLYACQKQYPCTFIRGNREDYLLAHRKTESDAWKQSSSSASLLYTYENLSNEDLDFFASLPICADVMFDGYPGITACHGSPLHTKEWIINRPALMNHYASIIAGDYLLCGHTHRTAIRKANGKTLIFCPSLGLPQDPNSHARITILTSSADHSAWIPRMLPLTWNKEALIAEFKECGLLDRATIWASCIIRSIREEQDYAAKCVTLAWKLAVADHAANSSVLPEQYWQKAAEELGIL